MEIIIRYDLERPNQCRNDAKGLPTQKYDFGDGRFQISLEKVIGLLAVQY